uniref:Putative HAD-like domain-containing protein n=1 Tax=Helianthus annuus TaxID=4232 RepID=A0A251S825_HELAN
MYNTLDELDGFDTFQSQYKIFDNDQSQYISEDDSVIPMLKMLKNFGHAVFLVTNRSKAQTYQHTKVLVLASSHTTRWI